MASTKNPFPGMNPFFENNWTPVHTMLIGYINDEISPRLPDDILSRPEERVLLDELGPGEGYRSDVAMTEVWKEGKRPAWVPESAFGTALAKPQILRLPEEVERWIELRTVDGRLVTVIEILSPSNKQDSRERYKNKQHDYLQTTASLVEIDLLRGGQFTIAAPEEEVRKPTGTCYFVCVSRAWQPHTREIYCCPLRERLPAIRIPLRAADQDLVLDLQPLIDRCYEIGRYHKSRFDRLPAPPLPPDEATWVEERLNAAGLRA
jgi:hypothetical protein